MSLRDLLARAPEPKPTTEAVTMPPPSPAPERQIGTRKSGEQDGVIPMAWPVDPATCAGNSLGVMIDEEGKGWLIIVLPDGRFLYLLGPLLSVYVPF